MMRDGEVEPLEGIVIFSSLLAARNNVRILAQVSKGGEGAMEKFQYFREILRPKMGIFYWNHTYNGFQIKY